MDARIPQGPEEAWSAEAFSTLLERLAQADPDGQVLDLKLNYTGEWFSYAFSPLLQSAGGDLVDRTPGGLASGTLDGPESVAAMTAVQSWIRQGLVDPNLDDAAFARGRVALAWGGHWNHPGYRAALGDDLLLLPLPRMGESMVTGQLEPASAGAIRIGGRPVDGLGPRERNVVMVFQNYALYPHKTVRGNLEFPLRMRGMRRSERDRRVAEAARAVEWLGHERIVYLHTEDRVVEPAPGGIGASEGLLAARRHWKRH